MSQLGGHLTTVRHPPVAVTGLCYGRADIPLAEPARAAEQVLAAIATDRPRVDVVWSSPSQRCAAPARAIAAHFRVELRIDERLSEIAFGRWDGRPWADIESEEPARLEAWMQNWLAQPPPSGESPAQLEARVRDWVGALVPTVGHLLIAHAGVVRALMVIAGSASWIDAMGRAVPPLGRERFWLPVGDPDQPAVGS